MSLFSTVRDREAPCPGEAGPRTLESSYAGDSLDGPPATELVRA